MRRWTYTSQLGVSLFAVRRLLGAEISRWRLRPQDTRIRNVLVTGKMSEQFPWLEPKSSDFALELFINPGSRKASETQCDHSHSKRSLRVCRTQVSVPGRWKSVVLWGGKCSSVCQHTFSHDCSSHVAGSQLEHGLRAASAQQLIT